MDAAGQLGADVAVPGGSGRAANRGADHDPVRSAAGYRANAGAADPRAASSRAADPRRATSAEHPTTANHARRPQNRACSHRHRDSAATGARAACPAAAGSRQPFTCARARGASAGSPATHGLAAHAGGSGRTGRRSPDADPTI